MTARLRQADLATAAPTGAPGHRSPQTLAALAERAALLRKAADRFFPGASQREAARRLREAMSRYREGRWRRERTEPQCPVRHDEKVTALFWQLLRLHDAVPSISTIRRALFVSHRTRFNAPLSRKGEPR